MNALPLNGVRVLDLTQVGFGPWATQILGDFGADVIKLEVPGRGDISRTFDPFLTEPNGQSAYYMAANRNKRSITIDLDREDGRALARQMALEVDVLVHNFRPGVAERLGLAYDDLREDNPRLVYAWGSGFGATGPLADKPGQDFLAQSLSGVAARNSDPSGKPQIMSVAVADYAGSLLIAQGVFLALYQRERNGRGQCVYTSLLDALLSMQQMEAVQMMLRDQDTDFVKNYLVGVVNTKDGALTLVGVFRPNPLQDICRALEIDDLSQRPEFATLAVQRQNKPKLWALIEQAVARFTTAEALARFDANNVLCSAVHDLKAALMQPQAVHNGTVVSFEDPVHGTVRAIASPLKLSTVSRPPVRTPPRLGEHTAEVLAEFGVGANEVAAMRASGVLG
jgi:crotonobetainyl-CoA:carnitine CoA-transferase CaiB-like acyl-CoA transferase